VRFVLDCGDVVLRSFVRESMGAEPRSIYDDASDRASSIATDYQVHADQKGLAFTLKGCRFTGFQRWQVISVFDVLAT
jgi:hypothetical protein